MTHPSLEALREIEGELAAESVKKRRGYLPGKLAGLSSRIKAAREALEVRPRFTDLEDGMLRNIADFVSRYGADGWAHDIRAMLGEESKSDG